ncbi:MAG: FtsX-like permease family protein [Pseudonocardiales bacterium]|nr:FtsX-like permease family protein [Hyphomicrobiales bacterium]MBV8825524.1 FtsX-like permease family protein [Hyphomicrobiales bacterium]MBV9429450.1 FtsX-like permease family protein [Bradyrhizobiaceae bacterium]MBV9728118.1 FtsX-like permease family protein [Pseudonocardiales bacterium]
MNDLVLIRQNLRRQKLRSALMAVSILIAFAIFGVLVGFERSMNAREQAAAADRLVVVNKINFTQPLPIAHYSRVRAIEGVRQATHLSWFGGYYQEPKNTLIVTAVEPETYLEVYANDYDLRPDARAAFVRERTAALVGETMAEKWGWKAGDRIPVSSDIYVQKNGSRAWDVTIAGIVRGRTPHIGTNFMVLHYAYFDETRLFGKDTIGWIALNTVSPSVNDRLAKTIDRMFANSANETATDSEKAFNRAFGAQLGNISLVVVLIIGAAFATILMIVGNTMVMAVRERTREIGVLKTLGFSRVRILRLILGESLMLALLGGLPGLGLAALTAVSLRMSSSSLFSALVLTPDIALTAVVLMFAFGLVTGLAPALSAFRLKIVTSLGRS